MNKLIPIAIIVAGLAIAGGFVYNNYAQCPVCQQGEQKEILSSEQAAEKLLNFVNNNILGDQATASLIESLEGDDFYKVKFDVEGQEVEWQISKDGRFIFPQVINLAEEELTESKEQAVLEDFAKCLNEKGMKFYGSTNCGWCQKQKELFGEAAQYLPYVECLDQETSQLTNECQEAGISAFPTWQLPNGEKSSGYKTLEELAELSGCSLE